MGPSLEDRLSVRLAEEVSPAGSVSLRHEGESFVIVDRANETLLRFDFYRGEWTVSNEDGHAHFDTFEEAVDLAVALLNGEARMALEYRGDTLAATWIEEKDGEAFVMGHLASFLSPFDREEWSLLPGEEWRVVRKTIRLDDKGVTKEEFERSSDSPSHSPSEMAGWLETALGPPDEGMRWVVGGQSRFAFQVPKGWRLQPRVEESEIVFADYLAPSSDMILRAIAYFRPADPLGEAVDRSVRPDSVKQSSPNFPDDSPMWAIKSWTLLFSDGKEEMMGILELIYKPGTKVEEHVIAIKESVRDARFVPHEWDMSKERE